MPDCPNTAQRLWQTWDGGDGKTWLEVPCGTQAGHLTYLCRSHKGMPTLNVPDHFKGEQTQRELARDIHDAARRNGTELQKA